MNGIIDIFKALGDPGRLRALMSLASEELCVCQIIKLLELAPSTVSKHLTVLHQAGLVQTRKEGRWIYYSLPGRSASAAARDAIGLVMRNFENDPQVAADRKSLAAIKKMSLEKLCCQYKKGSGACTS